MTIHDLYKQAQLAEAAYADFWDERYGQVITDEDDVKSALTDSDFSPTQADEFVTQWRVVDHQPDTSSGMSATLFQRIDANPNGTGE